MNPSHLSHLKISNRLMAIILAIGVLSFTGCSKGAAPPAVHLTQTQESASAPPPTKSGSRLVGESVFVAFQDNIATTQFRFTVVDIDSQSGMLCLKPVAAVQGSGPAVPVWVPQSSIKFMFGHKGLSDGDFVALQQRFNRSSLVPR